MVLGVDDGVALATKLDLAALFIERADAGFAERATRRFDKLVSGTEERRPVLAGDR